MWFLLLACAGPQTLPDPTVPDAGPNTDGRVVLRGATLVGLGVADLAIEDGKIVAIGEVPEGGQDVDLSGRWLAPAFIDSHVHLAYWEVADRLPAGGVAAAVDMAAPEPWIKADTGALKVLWSGPMVTSVGGYPVSSWGAGGYGIECANAEEAQAAVRRLHELGVDLIKIPLTESSLGEEAAKAAADTAHALGLKVASHAVYQAGVEKAVNIGVDLLAHTPTQPLEDSSVAAWSGKAVVSTLGAFGGGPDTVSNLRRLREAGAIVLYGTDLGNTRTPAIDSQELGLLQDAGLDGAAILEAGTSAPAAYWGLDSLGSLELGKDASLLVLDTDPLLSPEVLARPVQVWMQGRALE